MVKVFNPTGRGFFWVPGLRWMGGGGGRKYPRPITPKPAIYGIEMKFSREAENPKLINLV